MNIIFQNSGEIDLRTVSTFGCSVKESKNPIGYFGTGLKFAIAVLLRTGHKVVLQSGANEVEAVIKNDSIRGKNFEFVYLGDTALGFTTELGKNWEVWMAYRELYCNAKDEADSRIYTDETIPAAQPGVTRLIVSGEGILKAHVTREDFILEAAPAFTIGTIEVHHRPSRSFFYKGIKVMDFNRPALYTYNQTSNLELTEDRTVKQPELVGYTIARAVLGFADRQMLEKLLVASKDNIEHFFDYNWDSVTPAPDFFPTIAQLQRSSLNKINPSAISAWRLRGGGFVDPRRIRATAVQLATLEKAIAFCEQSGFMLRDEYPIIVVETLGENGMLALADRVGKQIFITEQVFQISGTKGLAQALIEEYLHLKFGFNDCSREMQNFLFGKMVSLAEELTGQPL